MSLACSLTHPRLCAVHRVEDVVQECLAGGPCKNLCVVENHDDSSPLLAQFAEEIDHRRDAVLLRHVLAARQAQMLTARGA